MPKKNSKKAAAIRKKNQKWKDSWKKNTAHYHEMTQFIWGEQWKEEEAKLFTDYKKMPLTCNKIAPKAKHVIGEQRQNTPALEIMPGGDIDVQTADVRQAMVKEISLDSNAKVVYQTVFEQTIGGGFSSGLVYSDYEDNDSFDQHIIIKAFKDPTKCFWDVGAENVNKTDGLYCGYTTTWSREKFASVYGKDLERKIGTTTSDSTETDDAPMQIADEYTITIYTIFERKSSMQTLYQLSNNKAVTQDQLDSMEKVSVEGKDLLFDDGEAVTIVNQRTVPNYKITQSKFAGDYELEKEDFPCKTGKHLPMPFCDQKSYWDKNGKQIIASFFKDAKDSQRYVNYVRTQSAYIMKVSRYDQFLVSKQNVRSNDTQKIWRDPATMQGGLIYDESPNGNIPIQLKPPELSQSLMAEYTSASYDIQVTTGVYDTAMGDQGNENSGVAIDARTEYGNYNTFIPFDSINRFIACVGEIVDDMIPVVYDTERTLQLEMKDSGRKAVTINKPKDDYGLEMENDMTTGKYKIRLMPGPSLENQKKENLMSMDAVINKQPEMFSLIADLYVENLPMANAIEMRNRLRTVVPPEIIEAGKTGQPLPPKQPQQDPMIAIKQQEIQQKMFQTQMDAQQKAHELQLQEQQLIMDSHAKGVDYASKLQELQLKAQENQTKLHDQMLRFQAEMAHIQADNHMGHSDNIQRILTHQPNHFKAEKEPANEQNATNR